jgi:hypothetical protein
MEKNELIAAYETAASNVETAQEQLNSALSTARSCLEKLLSEHGKGPYTVNGKSVVVLRRKGTMCTMPAVRVRKNKKVVSAAVSLRENITTLDQVIATASGFAPESTDSDDESDSSSSEYESYSVTTDE